MGFLRKFKDICDLKRTRYSDIQTLESNQKVKLDRLLRYAKAHSVFYKNLYKDLNINDSLKITDIPFVDKKTLMDNFNDVLTVRDITKEKILQFLGEEKKFKKINNKYTAIHSGGTSGTLWISIFDDVCYDYELAGIIEDPNLGLLNHIVKRPLRMAMATSEHPFVGSTVFYGQLPRFLTQVCYFSITKPISEIIEELNDFKPEVLGGYPLLLRTLAEYKLNGKLKIFPKKIFSGSFLLTEDCKEIIQKAFGLIPFDEYFATESTAAIATECTYRSRHIFMPSVIVEVLDNNDKPVAPGHPGKIVMTNLMNLTQPIIRYRLNDIVQLSNHKCPCGSMWPIIDKIWGRGGDIVRITKPDGSFEVIDPILFNFKIPGLERLQVIQEKNDFLRIKIVTNEYNTMALKVSDTIKRILENKKVDKMLTFHIEKVDQITSESKSDKIPEGFCKLVISKIQFYFQKILRLRFF